jgi:hypothetical protein
MRGDESRVEESVWRNRKHNNIGEERRGWSQYKNEVQPCCKVMAALHSVIPRASRVHSDVDALVSRAMNCDKVVSLFNFIFVFTERRFFGPQPSQKAENNYIEEPPTAKHSKCQHK